MADETVKKLLIKLGISTTEWKTAVNDIKSQLNSVNEQAKKDAAQMKATQKEQLDLTKQQISDQQRLTAEARTLESVDRAKAAWQKQQQAAIQTAVQQRILETAEAKKQAIIQNTAIKMAQEQIRLEQQKLRLAEQQRVINERQLKTQTGGAGGGLFGGIGKFASGLTGGGLMGSIVGGAFLGTGFERAMEIGIEKVHELIKAIEDATGPAQQLRMEFERLATSKGVDPTQMIEKLRQSTRGLVADVDLFKMANNFLKSGMSVSTDQMSKLIENTVNLGRSMGKSGEQISRALELAFLNPQRGMMILARTTGISVQTLRQGIAGLPQSVDPAVRATLMFNTVLEAEEKMLKKVGIPITTLPELFKQLEVTEKNFIDGIAEGILKTGAFGKTINDLSKFLIAAIPQIQAFAVGIGEKIGGGLLVLTQSAKLAWSEIKLLWTTISGIVSITFDLTRSLGGFSGALKINGKEIDGFRATMGSLALIVERLAFSFNKSTIFMKLFFDMIKDRNKDTQVLNDHIDDAADKLQKLSHEHKKSTKDITDYMQGKPSEHKPDAGSDAADKAAANLALRNKLLDQEKQLALVRSKISLDIFKQDLAEKEYLSKQSYENGLITIKAYLQREEVLKKQQLAAQLGEIEQERKAQRENIVKRGTATIGGVTITVTDKKQQDNALALADEEARKKSIEAVSSTQKEIDALHKQGDDDERAAFKIHQDELAKIAKEGVQDRLRIVESEFKEGLIGADDYIAQRKDLIKQEEDAVVAGEEAKRKAVQDNAAELARIDAAVTEAHRQAAQQRATLDVNQDEIRLKSLETLYQLQRAPIETQVKMAKGDITGRSVGAEAEGQQRLLELARDQLAKLQSQVPTQQGDAMRRWQESVVKTKLEIQELSQELIKMHDISIPLGGIFGAISQGAGAIPRSRTAAGVSELFGNMQQSSRSISVFSQANQNIKQQHEDTGEGPSNIFSALGDSFKHLFSSSESASTRLEAFGKNLSGVISGVMGLVQGVTSGKTGAQGALGGASAGAQFGQQFSAVPVIGPFAGLIGGAAGGIMGGIFGSKEKQLTQDIHKIQTQLQGIVADLQAGTISMAQAIQDLRNERQQAIALLSQDPKGGKGGGKGGKKGYTPSQAQAVIQQIDAQLTQLVDQQATVLQSLTTSLMQLSNPIQYQDYLQSLDQIIQKYQQFASAAQGNTQMVAEANQYLNDSLNQYVTTLSQNLNQAQQQAIQDALTLINLEYQRQQIINQEAQQEYDVLTQGVLTRQRTTAMTKGQEIGVLRYQRDMQLEQINEQIALQQYKVQTETQIFGLATTRIGLETQLLEAQTAQAQYQMQQVMALSQVVAALTSGLSGGALMTQITSLMSSGAMPTESGIMYTLLTMLGLAGNVPPGVTQGPYGTTNWLASIPATDASAAQFVAALDPNFMNMILNKQYSAAAADAQQYTQQGEVEGYDMTGLISWLQGMPSHETGGTVQETGPIYAHKGEFVLSNPMVSALNTLTSIGSKVSTSSPSESLNTSQLQTHQALLDITSKRTGMEMTVISARQSQLMLEMQHLSALNDTLDKINSSTGNNGTTGIEDMLQKVYENRGRYGSANFRRETL